MINDATDVRLFMIVVRVGHAKLDIVTYSRTAVCGLCYS